MSHRSWLGLDMALLAAVLAYAVLEEAESHLFNWHVCLVVLGITAILYWLTQAEDGAARDSWLVSLAMFAPACVAVQLVPLPLSLLRIVSPTRAVIAESLGTIMPAQRFASLSISGADTVPYLLTVVACTVCFVLVYEVTRRARSTRLWMVVVPLIAIGAMQAALGLAQAANGKTVQGTYGTKNHFAGLLEMALPITAAWAWTLTRDEKSRRNALRVFEVCAVIAVAGIILAGLVSSLSKMGFAAGLFGLYLVAFVALITTLKGVNKWVAVAGLSAGAVLMCFALPTERLMHSFGELVSNDLATAEGRWPIWRDTLHLLGAYPIFGSGPGTYGTAFLKHQTAYVDLAFTYAHNDYLQVASEMGMVGFSIFFGLMIVIFVRAIRAATGSGSHQIRALAMGCAGAMAALAVHSLTDSNLYVRPNALILSWISGIAVGLSVRSVVADERAPVRLIRTCALALACILISYGSAAIVYDIAFRANVRAERMFCQFGICDTTGVLELQKRRHGGAVAEIPITDLVETVRRHPADPNRWEDLGEGMLRAGQVNHARACFSHALSLAPNIPPVLLRAAIFYGDIGDTKSSLMQTSLLLDKSGTYDQDVFDVFDRRKIAVDVVLSSGLSGGPRDAQTYLRFLMGSANFADAATVWNWLLAHHEADDQLAVDYVNFLYGAKRYDSAARAWTLYHTDDPGYATSDRLFNGGFESAPSGSIFDWTIQNVDDKVDVQLDSRVARSGARSLRLRFAGTENLNYSGTYETTFVAPGDYSFQAFVRTEGITTDQGVGFRISDAEAASALDVRTEQLVGTHEWKKIEQMIHVPRGTRLLLVQIVRQASLKFDGDISGTAWIDSVNLVKLDESAS